MTRGPLPVLVQKLCKEGPHNTASTSGRRVRVLFNGRFIADTTAAIYVWEKPYYPYFYVPTKDVDATVLKDGETLTEIKGEGETTLAKIHRYPKTPKNGEKSSEITVFSDHLSSGLGGFVRFEFGEMG